MPSSYIKFAVDFDGNGRRDLLRSPPDVLASTANFLAGHGWQRGRTGSRQRQLRRIKWNKSEVYARTIGYFARSFRVRLETCGLRRFRITIMNNVHINAKCMRITHKKISKA
jgi:membrane-bound lytic murein transglycosylase B